MRDEGKTIKSMNLGLLLIHDLLFSNGIQAGEGPIKNAILRHKTRLNAELQRQKIKRGVTSNAALAQSADDRAGKALQGGLDRIASGNMSYRKDTSLCPGEHAGLDNG
jgi:hypothetical protein